MKSSGDMNRRTLLKSTIALSLGGLVTKTERVLASAQEDLDVYMEELCREQHIPGVTVCIVNSRGTAWSRGYGFANLASRIRMNPAQTVQNIGSVSKTITTTAVMQLCEQGKLSLAQDVNEILPFPLRNPHHPSVAITARQLLVHRSSINDGPAYGHSYACGPTKFPLGEWLKSYLSAGGNRFDANTNFHPWEPGQQVVPAEPRSYSNIGFGVLGYLVEVITGVPFWSYCNDHIFKPLGMQDTTWRLADVPPGRHAVPYAFVDADFIDLPDGWSPADMMPATSAQIQNWPPPPGSQFPHCPYEYPTYPDGGLRTTAVDLGRFLTSYINGGRCGNARILRQETVDRILTDQQLQGAGGQGLGWVGHAEKSGTLLWGHGGSDPGIRSSMYFDRERRFGLIMIANSTQDVLQGALDHLYQYCIEHHWPRLY